MSGWGSLPVGLKLQLLSDFVALGRELVLELLLVLAEALALALVQGDIILHGANHILNTPASVTSHLGEKRGKTGLKQALSLRKG